MVDDQPGQQCGNCHAMNAADAVVCGSCGVVMAAYARQASESISDDAEPIPEIIESPASSEPKPAPHSRQSPSSAGSDWRSLFDQTPSQTEGSFTGPGSSPLIPPPATGSALEPPSPPTPSPAQPSVSQPALEAPKSAPRPEAALSRAPGRPASPRPAAAQPPVSTPAAPPLTPQAEALRQVRVAIKSPIQVVYAGIALLLGGCVFSLLLAFISDNSTAIGLAFLCTVPIGLILFVVGYIMMLARREGRTPRWQK